MVATGGEDGPRWAQRAAGAGLDWDNLGLG